MPKDCFRIVFITHKTMKQSAIKFILIDNIEIKFIQQQYLLNLLF